MIVHHHEYDSGYNPSIPAIEIQIRRRADQAGLALPAIVDSGADASMIPLSYLRRLKIRKGKRKMMVGVTGIRYEVDTYTLAVQIGNQQSHYLDVIGTEISEEAIVGRDLLNYYVVILNGPGLSVEVSN